MPALIREDPPTMFSPSKRCIIPNGDIRTVAGMAGGLRLDNGTVLPADWDVRWRHSENLRSRRFDEPQ